MRDAETVLWIAVDVTTDELSVENRIEADPVEVQALVAARSTSERTGTREPSLLVGKTLYLLGTAVEPSEDDVFVVRGRRYEVDGEPHRWGDEGVEVPILRARQVDPDVAQP